MYMNVIVEKEISDDKKEKLVKYAKKLGYCGIYIINKCSYELYINKR